MAPHCSGQNPSRWWYTNEVKIEISDFLDAIDQSIAKVLAGKFLQAKILKLTALELTD
jgi:hypothetical protein